MTREVCEQIFTEARKFSKASEIHVAGCYGGASKNEQRLDLLKGAECVVATPGRFIDMVCTNNIQIMYACIHMYTYSMHVCVVATPGRFIDMVCTNDIQITYACIHMYTYIMHVCVVATPGRFIDMACAGACSVGGLYLHAVAC